MQFILLNSRGEYLAGLLKKAVICIICVLICEICVSQKARLFSTDKYLEYGELDKAKEVIDMAAENEKTIGLAKTWYYRGKVYHEIHDSKDDNYKKLDLDALDIAFHSYLKAIELDAKKQFTDDIKKRLEICAIHLVNKGVLDYNRKDYKAALMSFENALLMSKMPMFNRIDTNAVYNAALAAEKLQISEKAKEYYKELIELEYGGAKIFYFLEKIYKRENDTTRTLEIIKRGRELYPEDNTLVIEELNYYIQTGKREKAIANLKLTIEKDPVNHYLYFVLGSLYDRPEDFNDGTMAYEKALELAEKSYNNELEKYKNVIGTQEETGAKKELDKIQKEYFDILYNYGALYYNEGASHIKVAEKISDNVKYAKGKKEAEKIMVKALPYLEKALKLKPNDRNTLISMKELYGRMGNEEKFDEMKELLEN